MSVDGAGMSMLAAGRNGSLYLPCWKMFLPCQSVAMSCTQLGLGWEGVSQVPRDI